MSNTRIRVRDLHGPNSRQIEGLRHEQWRIARERLCLTCQQPFVSQHAGIRMCAACRVREDNPSR